MFKVAVQYSCKIKINIYITCISEISLECSGIVLSQCDPTMESTCAKKYDLHFECRRWHTLRCEYWGIQQLGLQIRCISFLQLTFSCLDFLPGNPDFNLYHHHQVFNTIIYAIRFWTCHCKIPSSCKLSFLGADNNERLVKVCLFILHCRLTTLRHI